MEGGDDVRIQHYVTFWSALAEATQKATLPDPGLAMMTGNSSVKSFPITA